MSVSHFLGIAIPAFRKVERLRRCLQSIARLDHTWLEQTVVVDDSGDSMVASRLRSEFPTVHWIEHEGNQGFARAANAAVLANSCEFVLLLNDDCELFTDPRSTLQGILNIGPVFAVALPSVDERFELREGAKRVIWKFGIAKVLHNAKDQRPIVDRMSATDYAVGGHAVFNRKSFDELGGFDSAYHPFYWEDVDLSQRALERSMRIIFADVRAVLHREDGAIKSTQSSEAIRSAVWRNRLLFSSRHARGAHRLLFPLAVACLRLAAILSGDRARLAGFAEFLSVQRNH